MKQPFWYIIVNPAAGGGLVGRRWPAIEALLQSMEFSYTVKFTEYRGHATRLADDGILNGYRFLLAIGGDGTNLEVTNGILRQRFVTSTDITYALMPLGTGNDWARNYQLSFEPRQRLESLLSLRTTVQDAGLVKYMAEGEHRERYFVNVAGMAYDAFLVQQLERHPRKPSKFLYLMLIGRYLFDYQVLPARIKFNDQAVEDLFYTINIGICKYSGGGMQVVPQAVPDDGLLALTFARRIPKWEVLLQTGRFYKGTILEHPKVEGFQSKGPIYIETIGENPTLLEADGELLGHSPAEFTIIEKALKLAL